MNAADGVRSAARSVEQLAGTAALITGASSPVGTAIARLLAHHGVGLILHAHHREDEVRALAEELGESVAVAAQTGDLRSADAARRLVEVAVARLGRLDLLVNGAAARTSDELAGITSSSWDEVVEVTVKAAFFCTQAAAPHLRSARGSVVNVSSTAASRPFGRAHHYVAAKAALEGITRSLALELAPEVRVNAIAPGLIAPPGGPAPSHWSAGVEAEIPLGHLADPIDIANCVVFLVTGGRYITGQTLVIDGGLTIGPALNP